MIVLAIDASTYVGDVAVLDAEWVLAEASLAMKDPTHERLMPAVAAVLAEAGLAMADVDRIVCGAGPGSFTSLRIAGGIAKGLAAGAGKPLYGVSSLALLVAGAGAGPGRFLAAVDALRGEFYVALYTVDDEGVRELEPARLIPAGEVLAVAESHAARVVSPTLFEGGVQASPRARGVLPLLDPIGAVGPVDLATWEPSYGRLAEAQVKWEAAHGRPLPAG